MKGPAVAPRPSRLRKIAYADLFGGVRARKDTAVEAFKADQRAQSRWRDEHQSAIIAHAGALITVLLFANGAGAAAFLALVGGRGGDGAARTATPAVGIECFLAGLTLALLASLFSCITQYRAVDTRVSLSIALHLVALLLAFLSGALFICGVMTAGNPFRSG